MNLLSLFIRQPVTVTVGVILTILAGIIAFARIPIQLTPNVEDTIITVSTFWEGASPEEIEQEIIDKQEERLIGIPSLREITSSSTQSSGSIRLEFAVGTHKSDAMREVNLKLSEVSDYPENVDEPVISASDRQSRDYIAWLMINSTDESFDVRTLRDFVMDRIEPQLERVPGVSEINVVGGREREVQIQIDPELLAQYRITSGEFVSRIRSANRNISAGALADGKLDIRLRTIGQFESLETIRNTIIANPDAGPVLVRDVADVVMTYKEATGFVRSKGETVIAINAQREIGSNVIEVMEGLRAEVVKLNRPGGLLDVKSQQLGLDGKLVLRNVFDQTKYINDALTLVQNNIWIGGGLAMFVLVLFLRSIRSVGIITLAIPISVIGAVVVMVFLGRSINVISLAGMAFAVGMVVDNAIVVLENIFRHLEMGKPAPQAAYDGVREVWGAVLASTLTTIAVFIPILLIEEEAGQLFRDIALAICAAVFLSLIVSVSVIPTAAARILKTRGEGGNNKNWEEAMAARHPLISWIIFPIGLLAAIDRFARAGPGYLSRFIYWSCGSTIARLAVVIFLTSVSIVGSLSLMPPADYLPTGNRNLVFGMLVPPPGYNIRQNNVIADRIEETIRPFWEAGDLKGDPVAYQAAVSQLPKVPLVDFMGKVEGDPVLPPTIDNYFFVSFGSFMFQGAVSDDPKRVVDLVPLLQHAARSEVTPGVFSFTRQMALFRLGGSSGSAVKVEFVGPDLDEIAAAATIAKNELRRRGYHDVQSNPGNFDIPGPELHIIPDLMRLSELGMTTTDLGLAVQASGDGAIIGEYREGGQSIDLKVISKYSVDQSTTTGLADLPIATPTGHLVPLDSVASIQRVTRPQQISRVGRQRAVTLEVTAKEKPLEDVISDVDAILASMREQGQLPPSIETRYSGTASKLRSVQNALLGDGSFVGTLGSSLFLSLIVVYLLMCVLFQSFLQPLVIMFSVPLATLGGFGALYIVFLWSEADRYLPSQKLDVLTMLGFILLIGVVVNNAILIVHQALNFMRGGGDIAGGFEGEMTPRRAIAESVRTRVRPIFMSMLTSVGGMLPLVLAPGAGSELYRGLGSVVVGGLLVSTIFTLLLVPMLLSLVFDLTAKFSVEESSPIPESLTPAGGLAATARRK